MINYISSLSDINELHKNDGVGLLILSANKKQKAKIIKQANSIDYKGLYIFMPKNDAKYEDTRLFLLNEINNHCKNRRVNWNNVLVIFNLKNHKINFHPKRSISIDDALKYGVSNTVEDLILKIANCSEKSFNSFEKGIMDTIVKDSIDVELKYYLEENAIGGKIGIGREVQRIKKKIVSC